MAASTIRAWSARWSTMSPRPAAASARVGGSTITQQVAKIFFTGDEYSVTRKIREAFLARRIESVLTKEQILELYLNQIFLGRNAYGVQAAARAYFDKDVAQLTLAECAYLAVLPQGAEQLRPGPPPGARARAAQLGARRDGAQRLHHPRPARRGDRASRSARCAAAARAVRNVGGYFMEEVRRKLIDRYGENAERGPEQRLCRRPVGAHLLRPAHAAGGRDGAARRPDALRARPRLARSRPHRSTSTATGAVAARHRAVRRRLSGLAGGGGALEGGRQRDARLHRRQHRHAARRRCAVDAAARHRRLGLRRAPPRRGHRGRARGRRLGAALDPRSLGRDGRRGGGDRPDPRHAGRLRRARLPISTAPPRRCASPARPSSRSSIRPRSTTA